MKKPENLFQHWWWIVACAIIFAAVGNFFTLLMPSRYEQSADIQILFEPNPDFNWTDKEMLSFTETIGKLIKDPTVQSNVIETLESKGFEVNASEFATFTNLEQRFYGWKLKVSTNDPLLTEVFLKTWQTTVADLIQNDLNMSRQAQQQRGAAIAWIPCLQLLPAEPMHPFCNPQNAAAVATLFQQAMEQYQEAQDAIFFLANYPPTYSVTLLETSEITHSPFLNQSTAIFMGLLAGIFIAAITIQTPWTHHLNFKRGES